MKKIIFFCVLFLGLGICPVVFAVINWESPVGATWFPIIVKATWKQSDIPAGVLSWYFFVKLDVADVCANSVESTKKICFPKNQLGGQVNFNIDDFWQKISKEKISPEILDCYSTHPNLRNDIFIMWGSDEICTLKSFTPRYSAFTFKQFSYYIVPLIVSFPMRILTYAKTFFNDLIWLLVLIIGLPLAFWVIRKFIGITMEGK